ncbi:MAG: DUF421 domain-containing protein [Christensenellales bacterium]
MSKFWLELSDVSLRSIISVVVLFILAKLMGKRQISHLTFFDYAIGISIGSIAAALAVDRSVDYEHGLAGMIIYALFGILLSYITLKSVKMREIISGTPTIIIQNGKIIEQNLRKTKLHVNDILEECRIMGAYNIADVEYAILETNGKVSVLLKSQKAPVTCEDLKIPTEYKGLSADLIIDGKIMPKHLAKVNLTEEWLKDELKKRNIMSHKDVLLASLDTSGNLLIDLKNKSIKPMDIIE